jgi:hypothetical protein
MKFKGFNETYINIRKLFGLVCNEYEAFKVVLTRALGICRLTDSVIGFQVEEEANCCIKCKTLTTFYAVVQRERTKKLYLIPVCYSCIKRSLIEYINSLIINMRNVLKQPKYLAQAI